MHAAHDHRTLASQGSGTLARTPSADFPAAREGQGDAISSHGPLVNGSSPSYASRHGGAVRSQHRIGSSDAGRVVALSSLRPAVPLGPQEFGRTKRVRPADTPTLQALLQDDRMSVGDEAESSGHGSDADLTASSPSSSAGLHAASSRHSDQPQSLKHEAGVHIDGLFQQGQLPVDGLSTLEHPPSEHLESGQGLEDDGMMDQPAVSPSAATGSPDLDPTSLESSHAAGHHTQVSDTPMAPHLSGKPSNCEAPRDNFPCSNPHPDDLMLPVAQSQQFSTLQSMPAQPGLTSSASADLAEGECLGETGAGTAQHAWAQIVQPIASSREDGRLSSAAAQSIAAATPGAVSPSRVSTQVRFHAHFVVLFPSLQDHPDARDLYVLLSCGGCVPCVCRKVRQEFGWL